MSRASFYHSKHKTMANIHFSNEAAFERFTKCREMCRDLNLPQDKTVDGCIMRLLGWHRWDSTIYICTDYDELSFYFYEVYADGSHGLNGGIIFHGKRDGFGSGQGPTFSVCLEPTDGYSIHT